MAKNAVKLPEIKTVQDVQELLQQSTLYIAEVVTGALSNDVPAHMAMGGRLVQSVVKVDLLTQLGRELKRLREEGKIKEDYMATRKNRVTLLELLEFIDNNPPDEEVFKALKSIFLKSVEASASDRDELIAYEFLQIAKKLTSMDILILKGCYNVYQADDIQLQGINDFGTWQNTLAEKMHLELPEFISAADDKLVSLGLLSGRSYGDKSGVRTGREFRLSRLGIRFCEHIAAYEE